MTTPPRRRHRPRPTIALPPPPPLHEPGGNRAPIGSHTLRAAANAHQAHTHHGRPGLGCDTCHRYSQALTDARTRELQHDVFDVPASAATAYAALTRPGGLPTPADHP
jgi:hypothetical protein